MEEILEQFGFEVGGLGIWTRGILRYTPVQEVDEKSYYGVLTIYPRVTLLPELTKIYSEKQLAILLEETL